MRVAVILLVCVAGHVSSQFTDGVSPQRGQFSPTAVRATRYQRLPSPAIPPRSNVQTQAIFPNQRIRRPITFSAVRPKGPGEDATAPSPLISRLRPSLPSAAAAIPPANYPPSQVKPVNEETEEESRETGQDREENRSVEHEDEEEESEENTSRVTGAGDVPRSGGGGFTSGASTPSLPPSAPVQYRSFQGAQPPSTGRAATPTPPSAPQYRPTTKALPAKQRKQPIEEPYKEQIRAAPPKPVKSPQAYDSRGKKPVAQIIRRYRNDNPDGSITWGFENDDGSYKEEIIGVDCVTRGKYGYVDPDGLRREYTYETGIKCDEEQREEEEENGFVDYQENKLVLPDGKTIDLSVMGKKQGRRPRPAAYGH